MSISQYQACCPIQDCYAGEFFRSCRHRQLAVNFGEGFAQGAVSVEMQNPAAFRGSKFCLPNPPPARAEALSEFVKWERASADRMAGSPTHGLFRVLGERYPCPQSR